MERKAGDQKKSKRLTMLSLKQRAKHANERKCKYCSFIAKAKRKNEMDGHSNFTCTNKDSLYYDEYINANNTCAKFMKGE